MSAFITGVAESALGRAVGHTPLSMIAAAARDALSEAGLRPAEVDGLFVPYLGDASAIQAAEYIGLTNVRYAESSDHGGGTFESYVGHAYAAICAGACEVALIAFASRQRSEKQRPRQADAAHHLPGLTMQFEAGRGLPLYIGHFALVASRHMHQYGTTSEQLAEVAVAAREWAQLNPKAWEREPLTVSDVLGSPMLTTPLHRLDMCLVSDGGGAVVMTNAAVAASARVRPVRVIGVGESIGPYHLWQSPDITVWPGARSAQRAFAIAGIRPEDVDVLEPYDASTIAVIVELEDMGFCARGEGGPFVENGRLRPGGALPAMTSGGGLSYNHPGAFGLQLLIEAARQARGDAGVRQVDGARIVVAHGIGGMLSMSSTVVLARE